MMVRNFQHMVREALVARGERVCDERKAENLRQWGKQNANIALVMNGLVELARTVEQSEACMSLVYSEVIASLRQEILAVAPVAHALLSDIITGAVPAPIGLRAKYASEALARIGLGPIMKSINENLSTALSREQIEAIKLRARDAVHDAALLPREYTSAPSIQQLNMPVSPGETKPLVPMALASDAQIQHLNDVGGDQHNGTVAPIEAEYTELQCSIATGGGKGGQGAQHHART